MMKAEQRAALLGGPLWGVEQSHQSETIEWIVEYLLLLMLLHPDSLASLNRETRRQMTGPEDIRKVSML